MKRIKCWNKWRKNNMNGRLHHVMVLLGLRHSPTFEQSYWLDDINPELVGGGDR